MNKFIYCLCCLTIALGIGCACDVAHAQDSSTVINVLDASGVEGVANVVLLVNPGDARNSVALVTNARGEAFLHDLQCDICTISALDPRGLFAIRTTEFSSSRSSFTLVMQLRPLIDTVNDPKAVWLDLVISDSKGEPLIQHDVVIRPTVLTLENNRLSAQNTGAKGHVSVQLRAGDYTVATLDGNTASEAQFEIRAAKEQCSSSTMACVVASPRPSGRMKAIRLQLSDISGTQKPH